MTLREKILAAADRKTEAVVVPEWDATVYVRTLTAAEREKMETTELKDGQWRARFLAFALVDGDGKFLFTPADIPALSEKSGGVVRRLADAAMNVNSIGEAAVEDAKKN